MLHASMLVIGDEILGGFVQDANSPWLARRLMDNGIMLDRVHTVPDEFDAIDQALQAELSRSRPRLVVTSGGIGSTPDDITYEAVARSLGQELRIEPILEERVERALTWTTGVGVEVDDVFRAHMMRMARIPAGGEILAPHVAWAPGVRIDLDGGIDDAGTTVVVLPGVPSQFRSILEASEDELFTGRSEPVEVVEIQHGFPESALNPLFVRLAARFPDVKLGSYPGVPMLVRLIGRADEVHDAGVMVRTAIEDLHDDPAGARLAQAWSERWGAAETERR